jgi:diguanylate cyclase (GGDEF)-like protein
LAGKTHRTGKTQILGNLDEDPQAGQLQENFKSVISAPLGDMGVVQALSTKPNTFTQDDARLLEMLLGHTVETLKRIRLQNKLKEQAIHDPLTGSYNRRYFTQTMEKELERSKRYDHPIAFLMADINRFKEINDRFGHQMGDRVLREVGKLLQEQVRKVDSVVRYGGDEFLIVLPEKSSDTEAVVQRIRQGLAEWNKKIPLVDFPVTLAIGTSYWYPGRTEPVESVLYDADRRMYMDKQAHQTDGSENT